MTICHTPDFMYIYIIVVRDRYNNYVKRDFYRLINHSIIITAPPERRVWKKKNKDRSIRLWSNASFCSGRAIDLNICIIYLTMRFKTTDSTKSGPWTCVTNIINIYYYIYIPKY